MIPLLLMCSIFLDIPPVARECICAKAQVRDGWCDVCDFGFVAGLKVPSKLLFTTIDHGHEVDPQFIRCDSCRGLVKTDGFCTSCQCGYFKSKLYLTPFTYVLAVGERIDPRAITCPKCREHVQIGGWCDECKRGIFGNVSVTRREQFDEAVAAFRRLKLGLAYLDKCELCGTAMYSNGMCPKHRLVYTDGKGKPE